MSLLTVFIGLIICSFDLNLTEFDMHYEYSPYILSKSLKIFLKYDRYIKPTLSATLVFTLMIKSRILIVSGSIS
jgi:hypothetical protein